MRSDAHELFLVIVDPTQFSEPDQPAKDISLRLVGKRSLEDAPMLIKQASDWSIEVAGSVLTATTTINPLETCFFGETTQLIYDLERTIDGVPKTIEQAKFTIIPDVAT
ncbi:MAG: hypothetical protein AB1861_08395 [Cyanobacteriota bacterium]